MSRLFFSSVIIAVFVFKQCTANNVSSDYKIEDLMKEYPGLGTDFLFFRLDNGSVIRMDLKGTQASQDELSTFLNEEKDMESGNFLSGLISDIVDLLSPLVDVIKNVFTDITKKFEFSSNITFTLYNKNVTEGINMENYDLSEYNVERPTIVCTHGFLSSGTEQVCINIKNNYVNTSDYNVIILDWSKIAADIIYPITAVATGLVADHCADFLGYMVTNVGIREKDIHLIGHSLGAHLMGFTGRRLINNGYRKVGRITGLDPAGPLFSSVHLNKKDAKFVDIIHTDAGWLGLNETIGHIDFFPNGGVSPQPGCEKEMLLSVETCSHGKSYVYYAKSILNKFLYLGNCSTNAIYPMGSATPPNARGNCILKTD